MATLYVNSNYNSSTEGWDTSKFSSLDAALKAAITLGGADIILEDTILASDNLQKVVTKMHGASGMNFSITGTSAGSEFNAIEMRNSGSPEDFTELATLVIKDANLNCYKVAAYQNSKITIDNSVIDFHGDQNGPLYTKGNGELYITNSNIKNTTQISAMGTLMSFDNSTLESGSSIQISGEMKFANNSTFTLSSAKIYGGTGVLTIEDSTMVRKALRTSADKANSLVYFVNGAANIPTALSAYTYSLFVGASQYSTTGHSGTGVMNVKNSTFDFSAEYANNTYASVEGYENSDGLVAVGVGSALNITVNSTFNVDLLINEGAITIDATSKLTADELNNTGTITIDAANYTGSNVKIIDLNQDAPLTEVSLVNGNGYFLLYGNDGDVTLAKTTPDTIYVSSDYNESTVGWGYDRFSNYDGALTYALVNAKKATIVFEKTTTVSGNCLSQHAPTSNKNSALSNLTFIIKDGAVMGNAASKLDMTYKTTIEAGGILRSARPTNAGYGNTHVKNAWVIGEAGAEKRAEIRYINGKSGVTNQTMSIALLSGWGRSITANNALIEVGDLGLSATASFTDTILTIDGILAIKSGTTTMNSTTVTIKGHNLMNENTYYSNAGILLDKLAMTKSTITVDDNVDTTVAERVILNTLTMNDSALEVEEGTQVRVIGTVAVNASTITAGNVELFNSKAASNNSMKITTGPLAKGTYRAALLDKNGNEAHSVIYTNTSNTPTAFTYTFQYELAGEYTAVVYDSNGEEVYRNASLTSAWNTTFANLTLNDSDFTATNFDIYNANVTLENGSTLTVDKFYLSSASGTFTMDYTSTLAFSSVEWGETANAITINTTGYNSGTYQLIDYTGPSSDPMLEAHYKIMLDNVWNDNYKVINGDLYLSNVDTSVVYVNSAWAGKEIGETFDGYTFGFNAFADFTTAYNSVAAAGTVTIVGNAEFSTGTWNKNVNIVVKDGAVLTGKYSWDPQFTEGSFTIEAGGKIEGVPGNNYYFKKAFVMAGTAEKAAVFDGYVDANQSYIDLHTRWGGSFTADYADITAGMFYSNAAGATISNSKIYAALTVLWQNLTVTNSNIEIRGVKYSDKAGAMFENTTLTNSTLKSGTGWERTDAKTADNIKSLTLNNSKAYFMGDEADTIATLTITGSNALAEFDAGVTISNTLTVTNGTLVVKGTMTNNGTFTVSGTSTVNIASLSGKIDAVDADLTVVITDAAGSQVNVVGESSVTGSISGGKLVLGSVEKSVNATVDVTGWTKVDFAAMNGTVTLTGKMVEGSFGLAPMLISGLYNNNNQDIRGDVNVGATTVTVASGAYVTAHQVYISETGAVNKHVLNVEGELKATASIFNKYNGELNISGTVSANYLQVAGVATVTGADAQLNLTGTGGNGAMKIGLAGGGSKLTISNGAKVDAGGEISVGYSNRIGDLIVTSATLDAAKLSVTDGSSFTVSGDSSIKAGSFSGLAQVTGGTLTDSSLVGGTVAFTGDTTLKGTNNMTWIWVSGGTLTVDGTLTTTSPYPGMFAIGDNTQVNAGEQNNYFKGFTGTEAGKLVVNGTYTAEEGVVSNGGELVVNGTMNASCIYFRGGSTIINEGGSLNGMTWGDIDAGATLTVNKGSFNKTPNIDGQGGGMTNAGTITVNDGIFSVAAGMSNAGVFNINCATTLPTITVGSMQNTGTINFTVAEGADFAGAKVIDAADNSNYGDVTINGLGAGFEAISDGEDLYVVNTSVIKVDTSFTAESDCGAGFFFGINAFASLTDITPALSQGAREVQFTYNGTAAGLEITVKNDDGASLIYTFGGQVYASVGGNNVHEFAPESGSVYIFDFKQGNYSFAVNEIKANGATDVTPETGSNSASGTVNVDVNEFTGRKDIGFTVATGMEGAIELDIDGLKGAAWVVLYDKTTQKTVKEHVVIRDGKLTFDGLEAGVYTVAISAAGIPSEVSCKVDYDFNQEAVVVTDDTWNNANLFGVDTTVEDKFTATDVIDWFKFTAADGVNAIDFTGDGDFSVIAYTMNDSGKLQQCAAFWVFNDAAGNEIDYTRYLNVAAGDVYLRIEGYGKDVNYTMSVASYTGA